MQLYFRTPEGQFLLAQPQLVCETAAQYYQEGSFGEGLHSTKEVAAYLRLFVKDPQIEQFIIILLNEKNRIISTEVLFKGTVNQAAVYPREIARHALLKNASSVIVSHNHPSGICDPSFSDRRITEQIRAVLDTLSVRLLDHLVITATKCFSFTDGCEV